MLTPYYAFGSMWIVELHYAFWVHCAPHDQGHEVVTGSQGDKSSEQNTVGASEKPPQASCAL